MLQIRKYSWIGLTSARSNLAYVGEVGMRVLFLGVILYIFLQLWEVTYSETGEVRLGGLTLAEMLWYLAITESITLSTIRVAPQVDEDVRTGALAIQLIRPLSYPLYRLWTTMGERAVRFGLNLGVGLLLVRLFVGPIALSPVGLLLFILSIPLAFTLDFLSQFLIGLGAFWLEDTSGLYLIYSRLTMILGGMLIPLELFPESWQPLLRWLPFASTIYGPARLFVKPDQAFLLDLLFRQGLFILIFMIVVTLLYRVAVQRINANGG